MPRFAVTSLHRNLSLFAVAFVAVHVLAAVLDTYVSIPLLSALVPLASGYERFWLGLGAVSLDLTLAMMATSLIRGRLNRRLWRAVHVPRLPQLAGRVRARHRGRPGPAARVAARPGRRLRADGGGPRSPGGWAPRPARYPGRAG